MRLVVQCPAKVNLFLAVGPRDATGYHPVRTILQAVSLFDTLTITERGRPVDESPGRDVPEPGSGRDVRAPRITSDWSELPADNTLTKLLRLVGELVELPPLDIHLEKRIPAQSGLGGGSSNAAGLLCGLQQFLKAPLPDHALQDVAAAVGVDAPFFLVGGRAKGEHYGEIVSPLPDTASQWLVVAKPEIGSDTPAAYSKLDQLSYEWRDYPPEASMAGAAEAGPLYNDFERVAPCESLELIDALRILGASDAALTGSGSAVYGLFESEKAAEAAAAAVNAGGLANAWPVHTLTRDESQAAHFVL